ncbi:hypothetical protein BKA62DRAFT_710522 [Auriculariales sp. MPI-PUGE-AT-0066]|nr:hypothetical protein BKA62DRAFT_710522 [Auriculariales sp. MPI-PUGE-AT-0066]
MSYANVAAAHPPPPSLQGHPDPALLNTHPSHSYTLVDSTNEKVVVAPPDFKSHPKVRIAFPFLERDPEIMVQTVTSEFVPPPSTSTSGSAASRKDKAKRAYGRAEHEARKRKCPVSPVSKGTSREQRSVGHSMFILSISAFWSRRVQHSPCPLQ